MMIDNFVGKKTGEQFVNPKQQFLLSFVRGQPRLYTLLKEIL